MHFAIILTWPLIFCALAVHAEPIWQVQSDLNDNGVDEVFMLSEVEDSQINLTISEQGTDLVIVEDVTWQGGLYGQIPELALTPHGSVQVISMNEGCCRHRWSLTLTVAYRQDAYRVAGVTYVWRDTLDLEEWGICDINLLTGRGSVTKGDHPAVPVRLDALAPKITDWSVDTPLPEVCQLG